VTAPVRTVVRLVRSGRRQAGRRLRPASALIVPVPAAEPVVRAWQERCAAGEEGDGRRSVPPHVTVLYPFLPARRIDVEVENAVAEVAARLPPFRFTLTTVRRFPGVLYIAPDPAEPFIAATEAFRTRWPHCPAVRRPLSAGGAAPHGG